MRSIWRRAPEGMDARDNFRRPLDTKKSGRFASQTVGVKAPAATGQLPGMAISGQTLTSLCPEYAVSGWRFRVQGQHESKTVGFWEVSVRKPLGKNGRDAIFGQELASSCQKIHIHVNFLPRFALQTSHFLTEMIAHPCAQPVRSQNTAYFGHALASVCPKR